MYVHGDTGKYLQPAQGHPSLNVIEMAREGLQLDLRYAIQNAVAQKRPFVIKNLSVRTNGGVHGVALTVQPLADPDARQDLLLISFQETEMDPRNKGKQAKRLTKNGESKRVEELEQDLAYTKENLQATIEEMQAANEELNSSNEELQSTNEELQSTNEELETSKEELQSVNEEIVTVNSELQAKIEQHSGIQNDMKNLLEGINIGTIFLDNYLAINRFTHDATRVFRLAASDTGRPLADIRSLIIDADLIVDAHAVLDSLLPREKQVRTSNNEWFLVRIMPYRTLENVIEGVVMTFSDITALKAVETKARVAHDYAQSVVDTVRGPLIVLNGNFEVVSASRSFYQTFNVTPKETEGVVLFNLGNQQWNIPMLHELLEVVLQNEEGFENVDIEHDFPHIRHRTMRLNARRIQGETDMAPLILLAMEDVTERKRAENANRKGQEEPEVSCGELTVSDEQLRQTIGKLSKSEKVLRESEEKYRTLFETMTQGVLYYDLEGRIIDSNPAAKRIIGLSLDQMKEGKSCDPAWSIVQDDESDLSWEDHPTNMALRTRKEVRDVILGIRSPRREGTIWIRVNAVPQFKPGEDTPYQAYATFDDITNTRDPAREERKPNRRSRRRD